MSITEWVVTAALGLFDFAALAFFACWAAGLTERKDPAQECERLKTRLFMNTCIEVACTESHAARIVQDWFLPNAIMKYRSFC